MNDSQLLEKREFQPRYLIWAILLHLIGFAIAPFFFKAWTLSFSFLMAAVTAYSMGIFHHMYLSHQSFKSATWLENLGVLLGTLTWRGPMAAPLRYASMHRVHHRYSDKNKDPHSPQHGMFHALLGWNWYHTSFFQKPELYRRLAPEQFRHNKFFIFCDNNVNLLQFLYGALLFLVGYLSSGLELAITLVLYGVFVKTLIVIYAANLVDLINHTIGYRNYKTGDKSTNSFIMAILHLGGAISWHNNHHARAKYFRVKTKWWEFDVHHMLLNFLSLFGAVEDIKVLDETKTKQVATKVVEV